VSLSLIRLSFAPWTRSLRNFLNNFSLHGGHSTAKNNCGMRDKFNLIAGAWILPSCFDRRQHPFSALRAIKSTLYFAPGEVF
jgi:hypothetical protein